MKRPSAPSLMFLLTAAPLILSAAITTPAGAAVVPEGKPGPNDHVTCATTAWVFGTSGTKTGSFAAGDFIAYPVANADKDDKTPPVIGTGIKLNPPSVNLAEYVVRGSGTIRGTSTRAFFAWDAKDQLSTFTWNGSTKTNITKLSPVSAPSVPLNYANAPSERHLRSVDEVGNIFYIDQVGNLMRATVDVDANGNGKFTLTGEMVLTRGQIGGTPSVLWASGDGVVQYIINDESYALKVDLDSHRLISRVRSTQAKQRANEKFVASVGGSTDFALSPATHMAHRYRYDPAATTADTYWPVKVVNFDKPEFASFTNFTGLMDGCTRKDFPVAPLAAPVAVAATAQSTFTQPDIGHDLIGTFKYLGGNVGVASTTITEGGGSAKLTHVALGGGWKARPPVAMTPEGDSARMFVLSDKGHVLTGLGSRKSTVKELSAPTTTMAGVFPHPPAATKLIDGPSLVVGVDATGGVWSSEHNGTAFTSWTKIPNLTLDPTVNVTLDAISGTSARFFTTGADKQVMTGLINRGATATYVTGLAPLPGGEIPRDGIGITYAKTTHTLAVASTTGTVFTLAETANGWDPNWKQASPTGFAQGTPGIVDDIINNRTYVFVRNQDNKLHLIKSNATTPGTYDEPAPVKNLDNTVLADDPIIRPMIVEETPSFGTVFRSTAGDAWLLYAKFGAPATPKNRNDVTFTLADPIKIAPGSPEE